MKTLEEAGNSSPLRLYLSGATPPLFHFANRTSAAPLRLTRCSRVAAAADAPKGEADGSDPAKFDARSSGSSSAASASPKTPADARRTPAFRPRGLSTPGTPASPLVATTSASAPCECPQPPAAVAPPAPPLKHGDRLRALGGRSREQDAGDAIGERGGDRAGVQDHGRRQRRVRQDLHHQPLRQQRLLRDVRPPPLPCPASLLPLEAVAALPISIVNLSILAGSAGINRRWVRTSRGRLCSGTSGPQCGCSSGTLRGRIASVRLPLAPPALDFKATKTGF